MENMLRSMLSDSARRVGLTLPCPAYEDAVEVGVSALAEGHNLDVAYEVARSVLLRGAPALTAA